MHTTRADSPAWHKICREATFRRYAAAGRASEDGQPGRDRCGSACLGCGEHDNRVLERLQGVPLRRNDQQVAFATLPAGAARAQPDVPAEHDDRRLAGTVVLRQRRPSPEGDHRLSQDLLMPAENSGGATATRRIPRALELLTTNRIQGQLLHGLRLSPRGTRRGCGCLPESRYLSRCPTTPNGYPAIRRGGTYYRIPPETSRHA